MFRTIAIFTAAIATFTFAAPAQLQAQSATYRGAGVLAAQGFGGAVAHGTGVFTVSGKGWISIPANARYKSRGRALTAKRPLRLYAAGKGQVIVHLRNQTAAMSGAVAHLKMVGRGTVKLRGRGQVQARGFRQQ